MKLSDYHRTHGLSVHMIAKASGAGTTFMIPPGVFEWPITLHVGGHVFHSKILLRKVDTVDPRDLAVTIEFAVPQVSVPAKPPSDVTQGIDAVPGTEGPDGAPWQGPPPFHPAEAPSLVADGLPPDPKPVERVVQEPSRIVHEPPVTVVAPDRLQGLAALPNEKGAPRAAPDPKGTPTVQLGEPPPRDR